jgi:PilZ domain
MKPPGTPQPLSSLSVEAHRDRRAEPRLGAEILGLDVDASLSQGIFVRVLNVSQGGALVELQEWLRPGTASTLRLSRPTEQGERDRVIAKGQIVRCWVDRLAPLRYRAALVFSGSQPAPASSDITALLERPA